MSMMAVCWDAGMLDVGCCIPYSVRRASHLGIYLLCLRALRALNPAPGCIQVRIQAADTIHPVPQIHRLSWIHAPSLAPSPSAHPASAAGGEAHLCSAFVFGSGCSLMAGWSVSFSWLAASWPTCCHLPQAACSLQHCGLSSLRQPALIRCSSPLSTYRMNYQ